MKHEFKERDHLEWNSEGGHVQATIKCDHLIVRKDSALRELRKDKFR